MWTCVCLRPVLGFIWSVLPGLGLPDLGTDPNDRAVDLARRGGSKTRVRSTILWGGVRVGNPFLEPA